ncbi:hypothetical protein [Bradyrhizobium septentrionale]|nr:hypothetical protein [Bradyrhizobium septentrionale]UGY16726.1 hypothetical protein HAP48_0004010 [Bradyrhizobium septentrionale]
MSLFIDGHIPITRARRVGRNSLTIRCPFCQNIHVHTTGGGLGPWYGYFRAPCDPADLPPDTGFWSPDGYYLTGTALPQPDRALSGSSATVLPFPMERSS